MENLEDVEHAMVMYIKKFPQYQNENMTPAKFTDGWAFATILMSAGQFKLSYSELEQSTEKWTFKLGNLKKIIQKIQEYFEDVIHKGIKTNDIDLIEISKNNNIQEMVKLFELVVATLTQAPNKEDHISNIMSLDERSQAAFMQIIQNVLEHRIQEKTESKEDHHVEKMFHLETENALLRQEIQEVLRQNHIVEKQLAEMKLKVTDYEQELDKIRGEEIDAQIGMGSNQSEQLRHMVENLKEKLLHTVRQHEMELSKYKEEISLMEQKYAKYDQLEEAVQIYKQKYSQSLQSNERMKTYDKQKSKLNRIIDEKEVMIKKMQEKMDQLNEENYRMQQKQHYTKMELEKRDVRFKQLEKQVKKRLSNSSGQTQTTSFNLSTQNMVNLSAQINEIDREEMEELKNENQALKKKTRENQRENNRLKRNLDKLSSLETDKKKLERLILDLNNEKKQQVQILLSASHDLYAQNHRLKLILRKNNIQCQ